MVKTITLPTAKLRIRICYDCKHVFETKEIIIKSDEQPDLFTKKSGEQIYPSVVERKEKSGKLS